MGFATVLHISDLHFSKKLTEKGRELRSNAIFPGVKSHSFAKIDALSGLFWDLTLVQKLKIDILLATGDITTDGSDDALKTALKFFEEEDIFDGNPRRLIAKGLGVTRERRLVIPGNHDRYLGAKNVIPQQKSSSQLEQIFSTPTSYPYVVGYRRPEEISKAETPALIFYVFDSTLREEKPSGLVNKAKDYAYRIARGRVERAECRWMVEQSEKIIMEKSVSTIEGKQIPIDYDAAIRIAVLHHHPVRRPPEAGLGLRELSKVFDCTLMENNYEFVNACFRAGIDIVLFGHQHIDYHTYINPPYNAEQSYSPIHFFCCPSTSEFTEERSGFYLLDFDEEQFSVDRYIYDDGSESFLQENVYTNRYARMTYRRGIAGGR